MLRLESKGVARIRFTLIVRHFGASASAGDMCPCAVLYACRQVDNIAKLCQLPTLACILDVLSPQFSVSVCAGELRGFVCLSVCLLFVCLFVCLFVFCFCFVFVCLICIIVLASLCALSSSIIIVSNFNILKTDTFSAC